MPLLQIAVPASQGGNPSLAYWNKALRGEAIIIDFVEDDQQPFIKLKEIETSGEFKLPIIGKTTLKATFEINATDEDMGKMLVDRCATPPSYIGGSKCWDVSSQYFYLRKAIN